ncbi:MAG TPA: NAD(P)/FAD-dependent oxidoreductase [Gemmatimonadaceae bacterium]|nr:NAD(P)/FAD-dependent oxidoreductase [Gemmatimonadaceae bacterium]
MKPLDARPRVIILGGGFGGLNAARALRRAPVDVTVVDRANHHLFQPLLYQVALGQLAPSDISAPIRWLLRAQRNATVLLGEATAIDVEARTVSIDHGAAVLAYDYLIVATGTRHAYFGHPEWEPMAPGLKSVDDAEEIRRRFLLAFECAERTDDPAEREAYLTFVIVGGGPTGVELAGMIPEIARHALRKDFRRIDTRRTRVLLLEAGPRILPSYPESLSARAQRSLEELGVEVRTGAPVTNIEPGLVQVGDDRIAARTIYWAAGNQGSPLGQALGAPVDRAGRVQVLPDLSLPERPEVFVVGDLALVSQESGRPVPGVAQGAIQGGATAARNILRDLRGEPRRPFRYRDKGNLATIGRHRAIAELGRLHLSGYLAWWFWLFIHILYLAGFRNRLSVLLQWGYAYFTYQRGVRLITRGLGPPTATTGDVVHPRW